MRTQKGGGRENPVETEGSAFACSGSDVICLQLPLSPSAVSTSAPPSSPTPPPDTQVSPSGCLHQNLEVECAGSQHQGEAMGEGLEAPDAQAVISKLKLPTAPLLPFLFGSHAMFL